MRVVGATLFFLFLTFSLDAQSGVEIITARPNQGEGVFSFLRRHNLSPTTHLEKFKSLNEGKFSEEGGLLAHVYYSIPLITTNWIEPIFGPAHQEMRVVDHELKGAVFYLVAGHGGPDPGAIGRYGGNSLHEDEYAYDITLRLARNLMQKGAEVHMIVQDANDGIRSGAILAANSYETVAGQPIPIDQIQRLQQRVDLINRLYSQSSSTYKRCVEIHLDSRSMAHQLDVFFYYHQNSRQGRRLAKTLRETFETNYRIHQPRRGFSGTVSPRNLFMLRNTRPVAVFIELGNIMNYRDQQRFVVESNRQALANWLTAGIVRDFQYHQRKRQ